MEGIFHLRFLGPVQVERDGEPVRGFRSRKALALLGYLAVQGQPVPRERLVDLFWGDKSEAQGRTNLNWVLGRISALLPGCLQTDRHTVQFQRAALHWLDIVAFEELEAQEDAASLADAVDLYRGEFLEGLYLDGCAEFEIWLVGERERWRQRVAWVLGELATHHVRRGEHRQGLRFARRLLALEPWREETHRQVMQLLAQSGQRGAALAQYETCRRALAEELGVEPAAETTRLFEQIRDGELEIPVSLPARRPPEFRARPPSFLDEEEADEQHPLVERPVFVARERELAQLGGFLDTALEGQGQVVFVTGEAGSGKTALVQEFARRGQEAHSDLIVAWGNCNAFSGVGDPYLPFRDVLGMLTGDVESRWAAGTITREHTRRLWALLPLALQALLDYGSSLIDIFVPGTPLLARAAAAIPSDTECLQGINALVGRKKAEPGGGSTEFVKVLEQSHLFEQYTNVLRALATRHPLLLILDDIQWADTASIGLLFHLGRRLEGARVLIVSAYRPDELALGRDGERHPLEKVLSEFKRHFGDVWVDLAQADAVEGRRFVDTFLDTEPNRLGEGFRDALFRHTGGHPLFTVEVLRTMQERGDLVQDEDWKWVAGPVLDWDTLPARVEGVIEERVGRLTAEARRILSVASAEGENFTVAVVARVQDIDEWDLLRELSQELEKRHRLVREQEEVQVDGRRLSRYQFAHVLFQAYLYNALSGGERRLLHGRIAGVLEELYEGHVEEIVVPLAHHYAEAREVEKAAHYLRRAGEQAAAQFANAEAVSYLSRAIDLTPETDYVECYALTLAREKIHDLQGEREAQAQDLATLERLAQELDDAERQVEVALRRANYANVTGDYPRAIAAAQTAIEIAQSLRDEDSEAEGYLVWGWALWRQGDYERAHTYLHQGLTLAQVAGDRQTQADALRSLGAVAWNQEQYEQASRYYEQSLAICREIDDRRGEGSTLNSLGSVAWSLGRYEQVIHYCEQSLAICREMGDRRGAGVALNNLGLAAWGLGQYEQASRCYEQGLAICREIGHRAGEGFALGNLGHVVGTLGQYEQAIRYYEQGLAIAQKIGFRSVEGFALTGLGDVLVSSGEWAQAEATLQAAIALWRELGLQALLMESRTTLARLHLVQAQPEQALTALADVLAYLEEGSNFDGTEFGLRSYLTCYRVLRASQDPRAGDILNTAHNLLQERAAKISDEELRRSFLENVTAHREIVEEFAELC